MNRKQKKEQVRKLQRKCEILKQQGIDNCKTVAENLNSIREKDKELYLEHIQILTKRLMDGQHYVTERVCVNIAKDNSWMYASFRCPLSEIEKYREEKVMTMMLRELCKRTDLLQRIEHPDHTTFYMEVLKLDDRPIHAFVIPEEYTGNPFEVIR